MSDPKHKQIKIHMLWYEAEAIAKAIGKQPDETFAAALKRFHLGHVAEPISPKGSQDVSEL